MPPTHIGRPDDSEIAPYAKKYVDLVPGEDALSVLTSQIEPTIQLLQTFERAGASDFAYAPGKWTVKEVAGHLIDTERIFTYRALRIARGDATPLPGFEQDAYVQTAASHKRTLADLLEEFGLVRQSTLLLFRSLPDEAWNARGTVSSFPVSVRGIAFTTAGHELHHFKLLRERYGALPTKT